MMDGILNGGIKTVDKKVEKKKGFISIIYVMLLLGGIIILTGIFTTYQHQLIIRNLEAAADLAAVESVRKVVDEADLRNEKLLIKDDKMDEMRDIFIKKIRDHMPSHSFEILRVEIPTLDEDGNVVLTGADIEEMDFPNSDTTPFTGPYDSEDTVKHVQKTSYLMGGSTSDNSAMELSRVTGNLATSGQKEKTSYVLSSKVTILFKTNASVNRLSFELLNYVNILSGNTRTVITRQIDEQTIAVTIQAIGQVVMR